MMVLEEESYKVKLEIFEGPLDLLLHLIKKNEINIYDIPIAGITHQYLEYIGLMKSLNLNIAGEFLVMASSLLLIKSKMMLPPPEREEDGEDGPDPRADLVNQLLEYKKYKEAGDYLGEKESVWRDIFNRDVEPAKNDIEYEASSEELPLFNLSLLDLLNAFYKVMEKVADRKDIEITIDELSVKDRISYVMDEIEKNKEVEFFSLFEKINTKPVIIVTFLAMLEMIRLRLIKIVQIYEFDRIMIYKA